MFETDVDSEKIVSTDPQKPGLLTSLTYQSVTMPVRKDENIQQSALILWQEKLIEVGEASDVNEAMVWIEDLQAHNPEYFNDRLSAYSKQVRDELSMSGQSMSLLHSSSADTLKRIAALRPGALILDECHHLVGHWGRVLSAAHEMLGHPVIIGLTATPPDTDNKDPRDVKRYQSFFGPIDYEVPVPAIVKDGFLAPYQDLAYFVAPTDEELKFVADADERLDELVEELCRPVVVEAEAENEQSETKTPLHNLPGWITETLQQLKLPTGNVDSWSSFEKRDPSFSLASRQFLASNSIALPDGVPALNEDIDSSTQFDQLVPVLDRYVRHHLRRSPDESQQELGKRIVRTLRLLGVQITETGTRACSSPVSRVLAYSKSKCAAAIPILKQEIDSLGDTIRAVIVTDFERSSAVSAELGELMDNESGGAVAAFKQLLTDDATDALEPILVTGSTILIDDEIEDEFLNASRSWLSERNLRVELTSKPVLEFRQIIGKGRDWSPRVYIEMITALFQQGLTKCLVGTRGLLGEGWDANRINVLVDLTTVTTSMNINQLRGRSFRLDPQWEEKIANNWDVVCIAPEFQKGFDDYQRFMRKHKNLYGVTDDGAIEKGVGHVHPAFTELKPEGLEGNTNVLNAEMLQRCSRRTLARELWKIGSPYQSVAVSAVEFKNVSSGKPGFPPFKGKHVQWNDDTLVHAVAKAVLASLIEVELIRSSVKLNHGVLGGDYVRVFIAGGTEVESELFSSSMNEVLGPLGTPRYVIERMVDLRMETFLSRILPGIVGRYFRKSRRELAMLHAVPTSLAKKKETVAVFEKHWNAHVSPGSATFAQRGKGLESLDQAKMDGLEANPTIHEKEIFL